MSASNLSIPKAYRDGLALTEATLDGFKSAIETWGADTVDNLNQLRLDVFGSSYSLDNDGAANNSTAMNVGQTITPTATINGIDIVATALTTGSAIDISDADALTTGTLVNIASNSASTGTRNLLSVVNDNTAATGTVPIYIRNDAAVYAAQFVTTANGTTLRLEASDAANTVVNVAATHATYANICFDSNVTRAANSAYMFFRGTSGGVADVEVSMNGVGTIAGDAAAYVTPADYAEMFECSDKDGIGPGHFVTLDGTTGLIRKATGDDKFVLGVISAHPAVLGDAAWSRWGKKYLLDEFNAYVLDKNGDRVLNPEFNPKHTYIPREKRPEWRAVGMLGKLNVRTSKDMLGSLSKKLQGTQGQFVDVGSDGHAVPGKTYRVVNEIMPYDANKGYGVVRIIFRGRE